MALYNQLLESGEIREDPRQVAVLERLQALHDQLVEHDAKEDDWLVSIGFKKRDQPPKGVYYHARARCSRSPYDRIALPHDCACCDLRPTPAHLSVPPGLYMFGSVGCGKTFLMDLLYESVPIQGKRRVHFHDFMLEVHQRYVATAGTLRAAFGSPLCSVP